VIADLVLVLLLRVADDVRDEGEQYILEEVQSEVERGPVVTHLHDVQDIACSLFSTDVHKYIHTLITHR
jgi:hypothetical protein